MKSRAPMIVIAALLGAIIPSLPGAASAQGVQAEVLIVLARETEGAIDSDLREMTALRRPPFNAFRTMTVLSRPRIRLVQGRPEEIALPNGRRLRIELEQVMPDGRFRVRVSINRPNQNDYLPLLQVAASPGDPFFVAGQSHEGGTLVIGIRVGEHPTPRRRPKV